MPQLRGGEHKNKNTVSLSVGGGAVIVLSEQGTRGVITVIGLNKSRPQVAEYEQRSHINAVGLEGQEVGRCKHSERGVIQQHVLTL